MNYINGRRYIPGSGSSLAKLMIVGDYPDHEDENTGKHFSGLKGSYLEQDLKEAGISREECYVTNLVKIRPVGETQNEDIEYWKKELANEILAIKPNAILLLDRSPNAGGGILLETLTGHKSIDNWRGSILRDLSGKQKIISSYTPSALLRSKETGALPYKYRAIQRLDYARAIEESRTSNFDLPSRSLNICLSSGTLERFSENYAPEIPVSVDIESMYSLPFCIAIAFSPHVSLCIPLINLDKEFEISTHERVLIFQVLDKIFRMHPIIGQNFKYDEGCLRNWGFEFPALYMDTMLAGATLNPEFPKGLAFLTSIFTREPYYKDDLKQYDPKKDNISKVYRYNANDAAVTWEVADVLKKELLEIGALDYYNNFVNPLHHLYLDIESQGFFIDEDMRSVLKKKYATKSFELQAVLDKLNGGHALNTRSPKQCKNFFFNVLNLPKRASTDEDTLVQLMGNHAKKHEQQIGIQGVLDQRRVKKTESTYLNFKPDFDGRLRTSFNIVGTENTRSSTSILDKPVRTEKLGLSFHTITKHGDIGADIRRMFLPHPGEILGEVDLSQAEARIVAILSGDEELLHIFSSRQDIHKLTASWITGLSLDKISDENGIRFLGKTFRHAGAYDMGKRRAMQTVNTDIRRFGIPIEPISEYRAGVYLDKFHAKSPKIRGVFHRGIHDILKDTRTLVNPFGWKRTFFERWSDDLVKEGLACLPQSTVRGQMIKALIDIKKIMPSLKILGEAHDSIVVSHKESGMIDVFTELKRLLERPIDFSKCSLPRGELIIPADFKTGINYKDLVKYKL